MDLIALIYKVGTSPGCPQKEVSSPSRVLQAKLSHLLRVKFQDLNMSKTTVVTSILYIFFLIFTYFLFFRLCRETEMTGLLKEDIEVTEPTLFNQFEYPNFLDLTA